MTSSIHIRTDTCTLSSTVNCTVVICTDILELYLVKTDDMLSIKH